MKPSQPETPLEFHRLAIDELCRQLGTSTAGISAEEARRRIHRYGRNAMPRPEPERWIVKITRQFTHFLALLLWLAAALAFAGHEIDPASGMAPLGWAIVAVVVVNGAFSFFQEERAARAAQVLAGLLPRRARVIRSGAETEIPREDVVPGDILVLASGDLVAADARVTESHRLQVSNATLTGEAAPVPLSSAAANGPLLDSRNVVFAGTTVVSGIGRAVVVGTAAHTEFAHIAHLAQQARPDLPPLVREIQRLTRQATTACLIAIVFTQVANLFACRSASQSIRQVGFFTNRLVWWGIAAELTLLLAVVWTPLGQRAFATAPPALPAWLAPLPAAALLLAADELRKLLGRRAARAISR